MLIANRVKSNILAGELRLSPPSPSSFYDHPSAVSFPKPEGATGDSALDLKEGDGQLAYRGPDTDKKSQEGGNVPPAPLY